MYLFLLSNRVLESPMSFSSISKKKLRMELERIDAFSNPKQELEQYPTSAHVAGNHSFRLSLDFCS